MSVLLELQHGVDFGPVLRESVVKFLIAHGCAETAGHAYTELSEKVRAKAAKSC